MLPTSVVKAVAFELTSRKRQTLVDLLVAARRAVNDDPEVAHHCLERVTLMLRPLVADDGLGTDEFALGGLAPWQLRLVCNHIADRLAYRITIQELAAIAHLSASHFTRAFKASVGCPPHSFILQQRIERAKELMLQTSEPLCQIALICGLSDQSHLSRTFRMHEGCSPAAWRRVNQMPRATAEQPRQSVGVEDPVRLSAT